MTRRPIKRQLQYFWFSFLLISIILFSGETSICWRKNNCEDRPRDDRHTVGSLATTSSNKCCFAEAVSLITVASTSVSEDQEETKLNEDQQETISLNNDNTTTSTDQRTDTTRSLSVEPEQPSPPIVTATTTSQILLKAYRKGLGGGIPGAIAGIIQVLSLMWLRTVINYQSRYGTTFKKAIRILYKDGGISRFYRGLGFALIQAPLTRFVATASNDGILALLSNLPATKHWGPGITTGFASIFVGFFRLILMPVDTCKTVLQVDSKDGFRHLLQRIKEGKINVLYQGSLATAISSIVGHYPWFVTYNFLSSANWLQILIPSQLIRNASIGLISSIFSDTVVNVFRVVKTTKQTMGSKHEMSYGETIRMIVASDGLGGLFGRGLQTRIFANALQSIMFTVIWRGLAERWGNKNSSSDNNIGSSKRSSTGKSGIRGAVPMSLDERVDDEKNGSLHELPNHHVEHRKD